MTSLNNNNNNTNKDKEQKVHDAYSELGKKGGEARKEQMTPQGSSSKNDNKR